jgi:hypothetical protein
MSVSLQTIRSNKLTFKQQQLKFRENAILDAVNRLLAQKGFDLMTMDEVAAALTTALGTPITYTHPGLVRFAARLRQRGVGWDVIGFMAAVYTLTRLGQNQPITDEVQHLLGRPPRTLEQFLRDSAWRWQQRSWT